MCVSSCVWVWVCVLGCGSMRACVCVRVYVHISARVGFWTDLGLIWVCVHWACMCVSCCMCEYMCMCECGWALSLWVSKLKTHVGVCVCYENELGVCVRNKLGLKLENECRVGLWLYGVEYVMWESCMCMRSCVGVSVRMGNGREYIVRNSKDISNDC